MIKTFIRNQAHGEQFNIVAIMKTAREAQPVLLVYAEEIPINFEENILILSDEIITHDIMDKYKDTDAECSVCGIRGTEGATIKEELCENCHCLTVNKEKQS